MGRYHRIDFSSLQHGRERLVWRNRPNVDAFRQVVPDFILAAGMLFPSDQPFHLLRLHPIFVLQNSPRPDRHGDLIFRDADPLADEIFGFLNARFCVDVDAGMAKGA